MDSHYGDEWMNVPQAPANPNRKDGFKPTDLHPELRRQLAVEAFINKSGDFVDTSDKFKVHLSVNWGLHYIGFDRSPMIHLYRKYAWQTADKGRRRETNVVQLLMPPQINVIPNAGTLGEKDEKKLSAITRFVSWVTGRAPEAEGE